MPIIPIKSPAPVGNASPVFRLNPRPRARPIQNEPGPGVGVYEVGYRKPPKATRFQQGQSGNPKGRPKGAKGLKTIVREILTERVVVKTASGLKKMTLFEAMLRKKTERAIAGDIRAMQSLIQLYQASVSDEPQRESETVSAAEMDAHDRAIIDAFAAVLAKGEDR